MLPGASKAFLSLRFRCKAFGLRGLSTCKFLLVRAILSMSQTNYLHILIKLFVLCTSVFLMRMVIYKKLLQMYFTKKFFKVYNHVWRGTYKYTYDIFCDIFFYIYMHYQSQTSFYLHFFFTLIRCSWNVHLFFKTLKIVARVHVIWLIVASIFLYCIINL